MDTDRLIRSTVRSERPSVTARPIVRHARAPAQAAPPTVTAPQRGVPAERRQENCRLPEHGAQRASSKRPIRLTALSLAFALAAFGGFAADPSPAAAASMKVVVVVGPAGSSTSKYITSAKRYASQARSYGAKVIEIYSPNATWSKVKSAAQGANVLIYLGHGNGYPSPYGPFNPKSKDGLGLNASAGHGHNNVKYYGEWYIKTYINLAPNAVVILNRLCYASGNNEWGAGNPTKAVAIKRVDNFAAGFLRANARAVFAEGIDSASYILSGIFKTRPDHRRDLPERTQLDRRSRFPVQVGPDAGLHGLDGPVRPQPLLPIGRRQADAHRGSVRGGCAQRGLARGLVREPARGPDAGPGARRDGLSRTLGSRLAVRPPSPGVLASEPTNIGANRARLEPHAQKDWPCIGAACSKRRRSCRRECTMVPLPGLDGWRLANPVRKVITRNGATFLHPVQGTPG